MMSILIALISLAAGFAVGFLILKPRLEVARARLADSEKQMERQRQDFDQALMNLKLTFKGLSSEVLKESREEFLKQAEPKLAMHIRPLEDALRRYNEMMQSMEGKREEAYGGLKSLLKVLHDGHTALSRETLVLSQALKSSSTRGRWGEVTLRRVVEVAGMSRYCDFEEQATVRSDDSRQRPDMIVKLPHGRTVVVDAKVPLADYMQAIEATTEEERTVKLSNHAQRVRDHMKRLGAKAYWTQFDPAPDFVVLFLPGESFFSAALEQDNALIEDGMANRVILATPTTLIVLLRSVALGWQQERLAENSQLISEAGKDLFERTAKFADHLSDIGANLERATRSFNSAVGSWETRVKPGAKRLKDLGATKNPDAEPPELRSIDVIPRTCDKSSDEVLT